MSSKALYLSKVPSKLIRRFDNIHRGRVGSGTTTFSSRAIEIWTTTCIVLNFDDVKCTALINPANPQLTGTSQFSYFPRGGPVPKNMPPISAHHIMPYVSQWGGIKVEYGMMFDTSVIDGMVHLYGGWSLQTELMWNRLQARISGNDACPVGQSVLTSSGSDRLKNACQYDHILHTAPPFYRHHANPEDALRQCYASALRLAIDHERIATPVLGAGCRGFPMDAAFEIATDSAVAWCRDDRDDNYSSKEQTLVFGLLENEWADDLVRLVERKLSSEP